MRKPWSLDQSPRVFIHQVHGKPPQISRRISSPQNLSSVLHGPERKKIPVSDKYNPFENKKFGRIPEEIMFDDNLSAQAKLIVAYIGGKINLSPTGKVELKLETVAALIGSKKGKNGKRSLRQAKRYMNELRNAGIIKSKKGQHTQWVWFEVPGVTNMTPLEASEVTNMTPLKNPEVTNKSPLKAPEVTNKSPLKNFTYYNKEINNKKKSGATPDSFSNSQLPKWENGNSQLPGNPDIRKELMTINQKHPTKQKGLTTINPLIKKEKKEKKEKLGATPDSFNFWHPYIDEIMAAMPEQAKGKISRAFINEHLKKKGGDRPYFYWVFDHAADKPDPVKWITMGIRGYYGAYLKSDEYESGETITEITNLETL
jgi:hypothetical protein